MTSQLVIFRAFVFVFFRPLDPRSEKKNARKSSNKKNLALHIQEGSTDQTIGSIHAQNLKFISTSNNYSNFRQCYIPRSNIHCILLRVNTHTLYKRSCLKTWTFYRISHDNNNKNTSITQPLNDKTTATTFYYMYIVCGPVNKVKLRHCDVIDK